jgi:hypothetical protein
MASITNWLIIGLDVSLFPASLKCNLVGTGEAKNTEKAG